MKLIPKLQVFRLVGVVIPRDPWWIVKETQHKYKPHIQQMLHSHLLKMCAHCTGWHVQSLVNWWQFTKPCQKFDFCTFWFFANYCPNKVLLCTCHDCLGFNFIMSTTPCNHFTGFCASCTHFIELLHSWKIWWGFSLMPYWFSIESQIRIINIVIEIIEAYL